MVPLISVCLCTYRRTSLLRTLESIARQRQPEGADLELVVVDNDAAGGARHVLERFAASAPFPARYAIEPCRGLSRARNRTLELARGDWLALIDDDEAAEVDWLTELLACAMRFRADAVIGAVHPEFQAQPPQWVAESRFFELSLPPTGTSLGMGDALSGNALLRAGFLKTHGLGFDNDFNSTGGEDTDFYRRLIDCGGIVVSSREASVRELVPPERMTAQYLVRRSLRVGEIHAHVTHRHGGVLELAASIARASLNVVAAGALTTACLAAGRATWYRYYLLLLRNVGKFRRCLGLRPIEMYKG